MSWCDSGWGSREAMEEMLQRLPVWEDIKKRHLVNRLRHSASGFVVAPWKLSFALGSKVSTNCAPPRLFARPTCACQAGRVVANHFHSGRPL